MSKELYQASPVMFRSNPIGFIASVLLCLVGVGIIILLIWWIQSKGKQITIYDDKTVLKEGLLSKSIDEVFHADIRNIRVSQSLFQRMFNVGALFISSAGQSDEEIGINGIYDPVSAKDLINSMRNGHDHGVSTPSTADEIEKLAALRDRGIITEKEFETQKRKLLA